MTDAILNAVFVLSLGLAALLSLGFLIVAIYNFIRHSEPKRILGALASAIALGAFVAFEVVKIVR